MTLYIVDLEKLETRYTKHWATHVPELFRKAGLDVKVIEGPTDIPEGTSPGAFLNFGGTNIYKSVQVQELSRLFCSNEIKDGDYFLFTDAWHPGAINLKYMAELLGIKIKIGGLWHAGSYDNFDFLGRLVGDTPWVRHAEKSFFHAFDHNYFATNFHIDMFLTELLGEDLRTGRMKYMPSQKIVRTGWPMEYMADTLAPYANLPKRDLILFPHRIAPEKQVEIFRDLAERLPQYEFVVCQDQKLTKHEYHTLLGQAKMVFSASLQETLGIVGAEGATVGAMPLVPDRLSYSEMYANDFKYPATWTKNWKHYLAYRNELSNRIVQMMDNYDDYADPVRELTASLSDQFFSANDLVETVKKSGQQ